MQEYSNEFLRKLADSNVRTLFARIVALTWDEYPINQIEGRCTGGSISIDGASAMRRSCSLTLVSDSLDVQEFQLMLNTKFQLEIGIQNDIDSSYPQICWFKQGIFLVSTFNTSITTNNYTINLSGKDKMAALNGEMGGVFAASTDLGQEDYYHWQYNKVDNLTIDSYKPYLYYITSQQVEEEDLDIENPKLFSICEKSKSYFEENLNEFYNTLFFTRTRVSESNKVPIKQIIVNLVHTFGGEPLRNIIVNDIPDGLELLEYRADKPTYLFKHKDTYAIEHMTFDPQYKVGLENGKMAIVSDEDSIIYDSNSDINTAILPTTVKLYNAKTNSYCGEYTVIKLEYGQTMGYKETGLVYAGDFIANVGETVVSALDKIKTMLVNYEYFYDIDGRFIFQQRRDYARGFSQILTDGRDTEYVDGTVYNSYISYSFDDLEKLVSFSHNPNLANLKNDYSIWGSRKSVAQGSTLPIHLRAAIDFKPNYYTTLYPVEEGQELINKRGGGILYINRDWSGANQAEVDKFTQALRDSLVAEPDASSTQSGPAQDNSIQRAWRNLQSIVEEAAKARQQDNKRFDAFKTKINQNAKDQLSNVFSIPLTKVTLEENEEKYNYRIPRIKDLWNTIKQYGLDLDPKELDTYHYFTQYLSNCNFGNNGNDKNVLKDYLQSIKGIENPTDKDLLDFLDEQLKKLNVADRYGGFADFFFNGISPFQDVRAKSTAWFTDFIKKSANIENQLMNRLFTIVTNPDYEYKEKSAANVAEFVLQKENALRRKFVNSNSLHSWQGDIAELTKTYKAYLEKVFDIWGSSKEGFTGEKRLKALYYVLFDSTIDLPENTARDLGSIMQELLDQEIEPNYLYQQGYSIKKWLDECYLSESLIGSDFERAITIAIWNSFVDYLKLNLNDLYGIEQVKKEEDGTYSYHQTGVCWNYGTKEDYKKVQDWLNIMKKTPKWNYRKYYPQSTKVQTWADCIYTIKDRDVEKYYFYGFFPSYQLEGKDISPLNWLFSSNYGSFLFPMEDDMNTYTITLDSGRAISVFITGTESLPACFSFPDVEPYLKECGQSIQFLQKQLEERDADWQKKIHDAEQAYWDAIERGRNLTAPFPIDPDDPGFTFDKSKISKVRYVDWREIIYQMAADYFDFNQRDDYTFELRRLNPSMIEGVTKYEPYFTDLLGFWRQLYFHPAFESEAYELPDGFTILDYGKYNSVADCCWHHNVFDAPEKLNFWIDFIEADPWLSRFAVPYIGDRLKAANDSKVTSIYFKETPNILWFDDEIPDETQGGYAYASLRGLMQGSYTLSGQGKSAIDVLEEWLYQYAYCPEQVTISSVPVYHLQPNKCLYLSSKRMNINGKYTISKISMPFTYNGTMSITATKTVENLY